MDPAAAPLGRRERKKRETRRSVQDAALQVALERGVDQVTVDEICQVADIAPRTFFNHFAGKDEALVGDVPPELDEAMLDRIRTGTAPEALVDDLAALLRSYAPLITEHRADILARRQVLQHPSLLPRVQARFAEVERSLTEAIAARTGTDPIHDARPQMLAAVTTAAMKVAMRRWSSETGNDRPLEDYIDESMAVLREGL